MKIFYTLILSTFTITILETVTFNGTNSTLFSCSHGYPAYIPQIWVCDGEEECSNGQDEADCGKSHNYKI